MENKLKGKIMLGVGGLYSVRVLDEDSSLFGTILECRARGSFRHSHITPLAGDFVTLLPAEESAIDARQYVIDEIVDRSTALIRPPLANLDYIFVTMAAASPTPVLATVNKLISIAEFNKIEPVIVITKKELDQPYAEELATLYRKCGFDVFVLSAIEDCGIEPLEKYIEENLKNGKTAAFAGASGIGKSTLLNRLFPTLELSNEKGRAFCPCRYR